MTFQNSHSSSYNPSQFLLPTFNHHQEDRYALILLNQPIAKEQRAIFERLWKNATFRICADGGANRLLQGSDYDWLPFKPPSMDTSSKMINDDDDDENQERRRMPLPNSIRGDLDSVSDSTLEFFKSKGVPIEKVPSQYATDLQKCIQAVEDFESESNKNSPPSSSSSSSTSQENQEMDLIIYGGLSGRLDQTAHTLHVLWQTAPDVIVGKGVEEPEGQSKDGRGGKLKKRKRSFVVGDGCLTWLLPSGNHLLKHDRSILGKTCGILPFGIGGYPISDSSEKSLTGVKVKTKGLEWDLDGSTPSSIGGFLSTSNHLAGDGTVQLECDYPIYWTVELKTPSEP